ncbi:glycoside hydrolase family 9 protein [Bacteroidota bacterium]
MMTFWTFLLAFQISFFAHDREPMKADYQNSAYYRWLNKTVLDSRILDDMESLDHWEAFTTGAQQIVDARVDGKAADVNRIITEMTLTGDKSHDNRQSLRMQIPTKYNLPGPQNGRGWGTAGVRRKFDGEDWNESNRISVWVYPDCPGFYVIWLELRLFNDGVEKLPGLFAQEGECSFMLRNHEWNHVVWEIGNVARDKITALEFSYYMSGNEPEATDTAVYYFDQLELEKVKPDHIEGWDVWPGRISYSHSGYQSGASKTALASELDAAEFQVIDQNTGETILSKPVQSVQTHIGNFKVMDFSEIYQDGTYILKAGETFTKPFPIGPNVWRESILKALNFFYSERCGMAIPGVHGVCHRDWTCQHGDKKIVINGGWHDAGDLTQGLGNTAEAVYVMFDLADKLQTRNEDPELLERLVEEATWGLRWIMKTSFRDGYRNGGKANSRRTNGIIGDNDDITSTARNTPPDHFTAAAAEAIAYRVLKDRDPRLANYALMMAKEDWQFAVDGLDEFWADSDGVVFRGNFDSDNVKYEITSDGILTAIDLWKATGDQQYAKKAAEWAMITVNSQQRKKPDWNIPLTGFFYTGPDKERLVHYCHKGWEQAPTEALTLLCRTYPDHPDWMSWYSAIVLHAEYLKTISKYTAPYSVFPASIYHDKEYVDAPESRQESFKKQVLNGIPLGKDHYLRLFPVWMDYRGHFGPILSQAIAVTNAAHLRGDLEGVWLSQNQLEWVIGKNPFSQSTMWGEGYDFTPLYTPLSGDLVGGLPVGIQTRGDSDVPYWPVQCSWTYKEIWVFPVIRWLGLMKHLSGPALVEGQSNSTVEFLETKSGQKFLIEPNPSTGRFRTMIPEGKYTVKYENEVLKRTFLPAGSYNLILDSKNILDFQVSQSTSSKGKVTISVIANGRGNHRFEVRTDNLTSKTRWKEITLKPGIQNTFEWQGQITSQDMPWVAVIIPDNDLNQKKDVMGSVLE